MENGILIFLFSSTYFPKTNLGIPLDSNSLFLACLKLVKETHGINGVTLVSVFTYVSCQKHSQVKLYRIEGGGHVWPGESEGLSKSGVGKLSAGIDGSEEVWEFFRSIAR